MGDHTVEAVLDHFDKNKISQEWKDFKTSVDSKTKSARCFAARCKLGSHKGKRKGNGKGKGKGKGKGEPVVVQPVEPVDEPIVPPPDAVEPVADDPDAAAHHGAIWHTHFRIHETALGCRATCSLHEKGLDSSGNWTVYCTRTVTAGVGMGVHLDIEGCVRARSWERLLSVLAINLR